MLVRYLLDKQIQMNLQQIDPLNVPVNRTKILFLSIYHNITDSRTHGKSNKLFISWLAYIHSHYERIMPTRVILYDTSANLAY